MRRVSTVPRGWFLLLTITALLAGAAPTLFGQATPPGFSVELKPVASSNLPGLQSFALGVDKDGKWLILGGRTNGLHPFVQSSNGGTTPPPNAFPPSEANRKAWVLDPAANRSWSMSLDGLPAAIADQLSANNTQSVQDGNTLYIVGGYGLNSQNQQMVTFGSIIAIKVHEMIGAIISQESLVGFLQQTSNYHDCVQFGTNQYGTCSAQTQNCKTGPGWKECVNKILAACRVKQEHAQNKCDAAVLSGNRSGVPTNNCCYTKVTGGGLVKQGNAFYLTFGQDFEGMYSVSPGDYGKWPVIQTYTEQITALNLQPDPLTVDILRVFKQDANDKTTPYHRRDLNVLSALDPVTGQPRIAVNGGVFKPGSDQAFQEPVLFNSAADVTQVRITIDRGYRQMMNQYESATLRLYDAANHAMIDVFFGGITLYYLEPKTKKLKKDEGLPFSQDLSVLTLSGTGKWAEFVRSTPLGRFMGTDAAFVAAGNVPAAANGVIYLDKIKGPTMVGYVFGGILASQNRATAAEGQKTTASNALYEVWINPTPPAASYWIAATQ